MEDLKQKRDDLNSKVREASEERRKLVEQLKSLKTLAKEQKELRNKANEEVKSLKEKRVTSFEEIKKVKKEFDEILSIVDTFKDSIGGSYTILKEDLKQMEWDYQTGVYSVKKEKELVKEMDELEKSIAKSELLHDKKRKLFQLEHKLKDLYTEANVYHGLLINRAKESEQHHDTMMKSIKEITKLDVVIQEMDEKGQKLRTEADSYHNQLRELEPVQMPKPQPNDDIMQKAEEIMASFKAGKKLSTDELVLLQQLGLY